MFSALYVRGPESAYCMGPSYWLLRTRILSIMPQRHPPQAVRQVRYVPVDKYAISGDDLRAQRVTKPAVTQLQVAALLGVGQTRISQLERQRLVPSATAARYLFAVATAKARRPRWSRSHRRFLQPSDYNPGVAPRDEVAERMAEAYARDRERKAHDAELLRQQQETAQLERQRRVEPDPDPIIAIVSGIPIRASFRPIQLSRPRSRGW